MNILVINCGSSSIKYQVIDTRSETTLKSGNIERVGLDIAPDAAMRQLLATLQDCAIGAIGHRVVHGGDHFWQAAPIDDTVIGVIRECCKLAPLHNPRNLDGILAARAAFPEVPQVAVFDTAFHATLPEHAHTYALPQTHCRTHSLRRFGFHGTSHQYVAQKAAETLRRPLSELRLISLHLGNGASACALEGGRSVETSMGMTPLEGLVMGTRSGDLDPGALLYLMRQENFSVEDVDTLLNKQSGLLGVSGLSPDVRELEKAASEGHPGASLALAVFVHRVRKYLGAYLAILNGADAIILTGGIGENSPSMRQRILQDLSFAGIALDTAKNEARPTALQSVLEISSPQSRVKLLTIKTNEELMIAQQTLAALNTVP